MRGVRADHILNVLFISGKHGDIKNDYTLLSEATEV